MSAIDIAEVFRIAILTLCWEFFLLFEAGQLLPHIGLGVAGHDNKASVTRCMHDAIPRSRLRAAT